MPPSSPSRTLVLAALRKRPTQVITDAAGTAVTAADTAVDVNRDIYVAGKLTLAVSNGAGNSKAGTFKVLVDEG